MIIVIVVVMLMATVAVTGLASSAAFESAGLASGCASLGPRYIVCCLF